MNGSPDDLLDATAHLLERGQVAHAMDRLFAGLLRVRAEASGEQWGGTTRRVREHALFQTLLQDPITQQSYAKPRGYSGDAALLDLIYRWPTTEAELGRTTSLGRELYEFTCSRPAASAVRERKRFLAALLDACCASRPGGRVLSVAAGHLREAHDSAAVQSGLLSEVVALDQDEESVAEVGRSLAGSCVTPVCAGVRSLLSGKVRCEPFDLIYSAGLYDYLSLSVAQRLTARLFALLSPGGRLWVCNFLPGNPDAGYMEAVMDWSLIYRTPDEVRLFAGEIPIGEVAEVHARADPSGQLGILELTRG